MRIARNPDGGEWQRPPMRRIAANDNYEASYLRTGGSWGAPVAKPVPEPDDVLAWPAMERLAYREDKKRVRALLRWRELNHPARDVTCVDAREDETPPARWDYDAKAEIRPREGELMRIVADAFRPRVTRAPDGAITRGGFGFEVDMRQRQEWSRIRLGSLVFRGNELLQWGTTRKGARLAPIERAGEPPKDAPTLGRSAGDVRRYLDTKPTPPSPLAATSLLRPFSGEKRGDAYHPTDNARAARAVLQAANDNTPRLPPINRCPDAIAKNALWLGGRVAKGKGKGSEVHVETPGKAATERELDRRAEAVRLRDMLVAPARSGSPLSLADVLDMATTDATAADIGFRCGYAPSSAEKYGTQLIEKALDALIDIEELDGISSKVA